MNRLAVNHFLRYQTENTICFGHVKLGKVLYGRKIRRKKKKTIDVVIFQDGWNDI